MKQPVNKDKQDQMFLMKKCLYFRFGSDQPSA